MKKQKSLYFLYLLLFLYLELITKIVMFNKFPDWRFLYIIQTSLGVAGICTIVSKLCNEKINKWITSIILVLTTTFYIFNYMYFVLFSVPFSVSTLELASQAADFFEIGFHLVMTNIVSAFLMIIPFIIFIIYNKEFDFSKQTGKKNVLLLGSVVLAYLVSLASLNLDKKDLYSSYNLYYKVDSLTMSTDVLGVLTSQRLSLKRNIFGFQESVVLNNKGNEKDPIEEKEYNQLEIDFASLINNTKDASLQGAYQYLQNQQATNKNEYTGKYKGKNLIFILAEGFNSLAVDKELTPTLYKLVNDGFNFTNYYSPVFLSTTGGEFQAMTSLIPTQEILGKWRKENIYFPYALGNVFGNLGYNVGSYHNWSYKYYGRDHTMPTLGFNNYTACGNGLEKQINCKWLPSDIDLINASFDNYAKNEPFMTYYISVSGHAPYNFTGGNSIAIKNKELVNHLPYSDAVKAYLAAQIEFDRALKELINKLEKEGILDDTVLVITGDHYPYTLNIDEINELSTYERDETVEVNHSNLIIWNNKKENKTIDKVASQIDVLPTLLNLFGIEYDSRLLIGNDIFSDAEGFALFSNRSWISDKGIYNFDKGFTAKNNETVEQSYIDEKNNRVANSFTISKLIMENDLYRKIENK